MTHPSVPIVPGQQQPPAPPPPAASPAPGPPRTKNSTILWICGGLVGGLLLMYGFVSLLAGNVGSGPDQPSAASDVGTPDCSHKSGTRDYTATVTVTNSTDRPQDYTVTVVFLRGDKTEITTGIGRINRLQPGKSFRVEAVGRAESEFLISCEVDSVRRS